MRQRRTKGVQRGVREPEVNLTSIHTKT